MVLTQVITVKHLENDSADSDKEAYQTVAGLSSLKVNIQPADAETTAISEGSFGKTFKMFAPTTASGVVIGDKVTVISGTNSGDAYIVKGKENWNMGGPMPHYEFTLFESIT